MAADWDETHDVCIRCRRCGAEYFYDSIVSANESSQAAAVVQALEMALFRQPSMDEPSALSIAIAARDATPVRD